MTETVYTYRWKPKVWGTLRGPDLKGRHCTIVKRCAMDSAVVRFADNDEIQVVSRNALRRVR